MKIFRSYSSAETSEFGARLAQEILSMTERQGSAGARILALQGDLGAGKTTFTQGFARGLGIKRRTASPTFIIMRRFAIPGRRHHQFKNFYHVDAYRLKKLDSLEAIGLREIFAEPTNVVVVEWPEKIKDALPRGTAWLKFRYGTKENERIISEKAIIKR